MEKLLGLGCALVVGLMMTCGGWLLAYKLGAPTLERAKASTTWPSVQGQVTESRVERTVEREDGRGSRGRSRTRYMYSAQVTYVYRVEGQERTSSRVWFGGDGYRSSSRSEHEEIVGRYPAGREVSVYYNPRHPEVAVLEPGAFASSHALFWAGWGVLLIGLLLLFGPLLYLLGLALFIGEGVGRRRLDPLAEHLEPR